MDIRQFIFPFIMAVLTNSILILLMFFLRKSKYFAGIFGVGFMVVLYILCIVRAVLPIEFPDVQIKLEDTVIYRGLYDFFSKRPAAGFLPFSPWYIILALWAIVSAALLVRLIVKTVGYRRYICAQENMASQDELSVLDKVADEVFGKAKRITLCKTDAVSESLSIGLLDKMILLPDISFDEQELEMILRHECVHIKNRDIWIKLLIELYCIIFWWNPFAYFLKFDLSSTLETRCDLGVIRAFSDLDKSSYAITVAKFMSTEKDKRVPAVSAGFSKSRNNKEAVRRIEAILDDPPKRSRQIIVAIVTAAVFLSIVAASYIFIWQPDSGSPTTDEYELDNTGYVLDDSNTYIAKHADGTYTLNFGGVPVEEIAKEDVESGMYRDFPVIEE